MANRAIECPPGKRVVVGFNVFLGCRGCGHIMHLGPRAIYAGQSLDDVPAADTIKCPRCGSVLSTQKPSAA